MIFSRESNQNQFVILFSRGRDNRDDYSFNSSLNARDILTFLTLPSTEIGCKHAHDFTFAALSHIAKASKNSSTTAMMNLFLITDNYIETS